MRSPEQFSNERSFFLPVNSQRSLWFESHLLGDRSGRRARDAAERLGAETHDQILAAGDQLAAFSPTIAQQFYRQAAAVWHLVGEADFHEWFRLGRTLLSGEPPQRDAALAYFSVAPPAVARAGLSRLQTWCATGVEIAARSRKLGAVFFESTAALIDQVEPEVLAVWTQNGLRLHGLSGWRGEFLAYAYFAAAPHALLVFHAEEFATWADLGVALQSVLKENRYFADLPAGLSALTVAERAVLFAAARALATTNAAAAAAVYLQLPAALRRLRGSLRLKVLEVLRAADVAIADCVGEIIPVTGALVHDIPAPQRRPALDLALQVAHAFPRGTVALLRSLPIVYDEARPAAVEEWLRRGLAIATENSEAGLAYFALQSRTSIKVLQASSTGATLADVQGLLRKYVQMLSGQSVSIRSVDVVRLRPPLEEFPLEGEIALPAKVDLFATHEDNTRLYRFVAAQLAGRREFGTYEVQLPDDTDRGLLAFLRAPEHPALLEELFLLAEGFRVAAALARTYPGLAREQRELAKYFLARQSAEYAPAQQQFDAVLAWLLCARDGEACPAWLAPLASVVAPCVALLASASATANDALSVALLLAEQLTVPDAKREGSVDEFAFDKVSGDALIPYMDYDDSPGLPGDGGPAEADEVPTSPLTLPDEVQLELDPLSEDSAAGAPLSADELKRLIEAGADLRLTQGHSDEVDGLGLYITDLLGKIPPERIEELRRLLNESARTDGPPPRRWLERDRDGAAFYYDEWDYHISDYRQRWCRLREVPLEGDAGEFFNQTLADYAALIPEVRRQFQRIRPEMYRTVRGLEDGEDFDLNAVVTARVDRRARRPASSKFYVARAREERDVATLFLLDMSASTDEPLQRPVPVTGEEDDPLGGFARRSSQPTKAPRRIIDVTKEALVIMAEALEEIGDAYAIYGFSGHGRNNVEFYLVKAFNEPLSPAVRGRIGAIEPKRSTRMGTALRHATEKMAAVSSRSRHIILLSDGFPQDFDYGQDRRSNVYGLRDTTVALREAETNGITPFCITVDKAGHDYLREMCDGSRYMVIEDIAALPRELPKIYQRVVTV